MKSDTQSLWRLLVVPSGHQDNPVTILETVKYRQAEGTTKGPHLPPKRFYSHPHPHFHFTHLNAPRSSVGGQKSRGGTGRLRKCGRRG